MDLSVSKESAKTLLDLFLDDGNLVAIGDKQFVIKNLNVFSQGLIMRSLQSLSDESIDIIGEAIKNKDSLDIKTLLNAGEELFNLAGRITAICILSRQFTRDVAKNETLIDDTIVDLALSTTNRAEWFVILLASIKTMYSDLESVFQISSLARSLCSATMGKRQTKAEQVQFLSPLRR